jgi:hypothetical protein
MMSSHNEDKTMPTRDLWNASIKLNYDVGNLIQAGYSTDQIKGALDGKYTVEELLKMQPARKPQQE